MLHPDLILKTESTLAEGSLWDWERRRLLWVNIYDGEVHTFDPASGKDRIVAKANEAVGAVVCRERGGLAAILSSGYYLADEQTGAFTFLCDPDAGRPRERYNDGKCDPAGRFWAGTIEYQNGQGSLYKLNTDHSAERMEQGIRISNGMAWSPDNSTMYYTDSQTRAIWAYDYELETGNITNRRVAVEIPKDEGVPDGFVADAEGMLWVAQWGGWQVSRWDPATGRKLDKVPLPVSLVSSCTLGGDNLDVLYITTARENLTPAELAAQPLSGSLFAVDAGVKGLRANSFKG